MAEEVKPKFYSPLTVAQCNGLCPVCDKLHHYAFDAARSLEDQMGVLRQQCPNKKELPKCETCGVVSEYVIVNDRPDARHKALCPDCVWDIPIGNPNFLARMGRRKSPHPIIPEEGNETP